MTDLNQDPIFNVIHKQIRRGIDVAIEKECFSSAVILILSAIDAMAFLTMEDSREDVRQSDFIRWSEKYIRFRGREQLTGSDLYGARCAMLHTFGARSRMSKEGRCRSIIWADRGNPPILTHPQQPGHVIVAIPALRNAFFEGIDRCLIDIYKNPQSPEAKLMNERFSMTVYEMAAAELRDKR